MQTLFTLKSTFIMFQAYQMHNLTMFGMTDWKTFNWISSDGCIGVKWWTWSWIWVWNPKLEIFNWPPRARLMGNGRTLLPSFAFQSTFNNNMLQILSSSLKSVKSGIRGFELSFWNPKLTNEDSSYLEIYIHKIPSLPDA